MLYHALRRKKLTTLKVKDFNPLRKGVPHLRIHAKDRKLRYVPTLPGTLTLIDEYLEAAAHREHADEALFRPMHNRVAGHIRYAITYDNVYHEIVKNYFDQLGI